MALLPSWGCTHSQEEEEEEVEKESEDVPEFVAAAEEEEEEESEVSDLEVSTQFVVYHYMPVYCRASQRGSF